MSLKFKTNELADLMRNFNILTGMRIVLFDEKYNEIFAYPSECSPFCACMRRDPDFYKLCCESDKISFENCKKTGELTMYKCHAGLIETTYPIMNNNTIIGYIMFGQISDSKNKEDFRNQLLEFANNYQHDDSIQEKIRQVKFKNKKQLVAASKILETCTSYIVHKEIIEPARVDLFSSIDEYISANISEDISVPLLCEKFNISRTRLYALCNHYIPGGIALYIRSKRMEKAKELLRNTDMTVSEISSAVGINDYNYFLKTFKKYFGVSTRAMRQEN